MMKLEHVAINVPEIKQVLWFDRVCLCAIAVANDFTVSPSDYDDPWQQKCRSQVRKIVSSLGDKALQDYMFWIPFECNDVDFVCTLSFEYGKYLQSV
jgi:hypothetical protein